MLLGVNEFTHRLTFQRTSASPQSESSPRTETPSSHATKDSVRSEERESERIIVKEEPIDVDAFIPPPESTSEEEVSDEQIQDALAGMKNVRLNVTHRLPSTFLTCLDTP